MLSGQQQPSRPEIGGVVRYLESKPFSVPTTSKPMSEEKYDLRVMTFAEFKDKYGVTTKEYNELCRLDQAGFLD